MVRTSVARLRWPAVLVTLLAVAACGTGPSTGPGALAELRVNTVANAVLAVPLVGLDTSAAIAAHASPVRFVPARSPDDFRANLASGSVDVATLPTQVAAGLASGGLDVRLVGVLSADLLKLVGPRGTDGWPGLRGTTVHLPFRGEAADLIFRLLLQRNGLAPDRDVTLAYATSPVELVTGIQTGVVDRAVLPEHYATTVRGSVPGVEEILSLRDEWSVATGATLPSVAIVVRGELADRRPELVAALREHFATATTAVVADPSPHAARLSELSGMPSHLVPELVPRLGITFTEPLAARGDVEIMLRMLMELEPRVSGGRLPDAAFYGGAD